MEPAELGFSSQFGRVGAPIKTERGPPRGVLQTLTKIHSTFPWESSINGEGAPGVALMSHVIPKRKIAIQALLVTGEQVRGSVFLDYIDTIHRGEQTLLDKLNDDYQWFALAPETGPLTIINRDHVMLVEPGLGVGAELVRKDNSPVFRRERVTINLEHGRTLVGQIAMDLPDEFSRVSDFLNFPQSFFALETEEGPVLVSKEHVVTLHPHEKPPAMPSAADREIEERA
jgi:hypothetical protein